MGAPTTTPLIDAVLDCQPRTYWSYESTESRKLVQRKDKYIGRGLGPELNVSSGHCRRRKYAGWSPFVIRSRGISTFRLLFGKACAERPPDVRTFRAVRCNVLRPYDPSAVLSFPRVAKKKAKKHGVFLATISTMARKRRGMGAGCSSATKPPARTTLQHKAHHRGRRRPRHHRLLRCSTMARR